MPSSCTDILSLISTNQWGFNVPFLTRRRCQGRPKRGVQLQTAPNHQNTPGMNNRREIEIETVQVHYPGTCHCQMMNRTLNSYCTSCQGLSRTATLVVEMDIKSSLYCVPCIFLLMLIDSAFQCFCINY